MNWLSIATLPVVIYLFRLCKPTQSSRLHDRILDFAATTSAILGLSAVLSTGGLVQFYLNAAITSSETNLYATAYNQQLYMFPHLETWIEFFSDWQFISIAAATILVTHLAKNVREVFFYSAAACFIMLLSWDIWTEGISNKLSVGSVATDATFNAVGAIFAAALIILAYHVVDILILYSTTRWYPNLLAAVAAPLILGFSISLFTYISLAAAYRPSIAHVEMELAPPITGYYGPKTIAKNGKNVTDKSSLPKAFGIFSNPTEISAPITITTTDSPFNIKWNKSNPSDKTKVTLGIYSGCTGEGTEQFQGKNALPITITNVSSFSATMTQGDVDFSTIPENDDDVYFYIKEKDDIPYFWIEKSKKENAYNITTFEGPNHHLHLWSIEGNLFAEISGSLFSFEKNGVVAHTKRSILLTINGKKHSLNFLPPKTMNMSKKNGCKLIRPPYDLAADTTNIPSEFSNVVIVFKIYGQELQTEINTSEHDSATVESGEGWYGVNGVSADDASKLVNSGSLGTFSASNVKRMILDGEEVPTTPAQTFSMQQADLQADFDDTSSLRVSGTTEVLFRDRSRLNRTRLEKMDWRVISGIVAGLLALGSFIVTVVVKFLVTNRQIFWLSV